MGIRRSLVCSLALVLTSAVVAEGFGQTPVAPAAPVSLDEALAKCNEALAREPTAANYLRRGQVYFQRKEWHNAVVDATTAAKLDPANAQVYYLFRSQVHRVGGDFEEAVRDADMVVLLKPTLAEGYFVRSLAYSKAGHHQSAVRDLDKVLELEPETVLAYLLRGNAWRTLGDDTKALADYGEALRRSPRDAVLHWNRGNAYWRLGDFASAQSDYEAALALEPNKPEFLLTAASFHATCADPNYRNAAKAFEYVSRAGEQTKWADWGSLAALGDVYAESGDFAKAGQAVTHALATAPASEQERLRARQALFQAGKPYRQEVMKR